MCEVYIFLPRHRGVLCVYRIINVKCDAVKTKATVTQCRLRYGEIYTHLLNIVTIILQKLGSDFDHTYTLLSLVQKSVFLDHETLINLIISQ